MEGQRGGGEGVEQRAPTNGRETTQAQARTGAYLGGMVAYCFASTGKDSTQVDTRVAPTVATIHDASKASFDSVCACARGVGGGVHVCVNMHGFVPYMFMQTTYTQTRSEKQSVHPRSLIRVYVSCGV